MAKVNASVELASIHIYLMILGLNPTEIVEIMTSPIVEEIVYQLKDDIFTKDYSNTVSSIIKDLKNKYGKMPEILSMVQNFESIYSGAQELKRLAKLLSINQKTKANIE